jgi:hypothetical protein
MGLSQRRVVVQFGLDGVQSDAKISKWVVQTTRNSDEES